MTWERVLEEEIELEPIHGSGARHLGRFLEELRIISFFLPQRERGLEAGMH